jgi:hypothetical protein
MEKKWIIQDLDDVQLFASSEFNSKHSAKLARLNSREGMANWSSKKNDNEQWLGVDLGKEENIVAVAIQGRFNQAQWVTKYNLQISNDLKNWNTIENLDGSKDQETVVISNLPTPVKGRYLKFVPTSWQGHISMRIDVCILSGMTQEEKISNPETDFCNEYDEKLEELKRKELEIARKEAELNAKLSEIAKKETEGTAKNGIQWLDIDKEIVDEKAGKLSKETQEILKRGLSTTEKLMKMIDEQVKQRDKENEKNKIEPSQRENYKLQNPITGNLFSVASKDFPKSLTFNEAVNACQGLGRGWRLPTKEELLMIDENRDAIGGFKNQKQKPDADGAYRDKHSIYISSTKDEKSAWCVDFYTGEPFVGDYRDAKETKYWVRAVKNG